LAISNKQEEVCQNSEYVLTSLSLVTLTFLDN
jgi:hypothetical protein